MSSEARQRVKKLRICTRGSNPRRPGGEPTPYSSTVTTVQEVDQAKWSRGRPSPRFARVFDEDLFHIIWDYVE